MNRPLNLKHLHSDSITCSSGCSVEIITQGCGAVSHTHTHLSTVLTYNPQKKCAGTHHYIMGHNSPSAIQSHGRQGQPATRSHPSPALIITLGPLRRESGSPGPEIVARKRLCRAKSLCNPILIQACILLSGVRKVQQWLVKKRGMCVCVSVCVPMHVKGA